MDIKEDLISAIRVRPRIFVSRRRMTWHAAPAGGVLDPKRCVPSQRDRHDSPTPWF